MIQIHLTESSSSLIDCVKFMVFFSVLWQELILPKLLQICKSVMCHSAIETGFLFWNSPKELDPAYKIDLALWVWFGRENTVLITEELGYFFDQTIHYVLYFHFCLAYNNKTKVLLTLISSVSYTSVRFSAVKVLMPARNSNPWKPPY